MRHHQLPATLLAALVLLATHALAQSVSHPLSVSTPSYIGLRITGTGTGPRSVTFDYATNPTNYLTTIDNGGGTLPPTTVNRFDNIEVNVVGFGYWSLHVQATPLDYTGPGTGAGLNLERPPRQPRQRLRTHPKRHHHLLVPRHLQHHLEPRHHAPTHRPQPPRHQRLAQPFSFNGLDYTLNVNGNEDAGTYATTVTYYLTFP